MKVHVFITLCVLAAALTPTAHSQTPRTRQPDQYEITAQMSEAMRYLSTDPELALTLLRKINEQYPRRERILTRMGYAFQVLGQADSAEVFYQSALEVNPRSLQAGKSLGALYLTSDRQRQAMAVFGRLLDATEHSLGAYKTVGGVLRDLGRYDEALEIYESGRQHSERNYILALEIAALHKSKGDYAAALAEYLDYVGLQARNYRFTRDRILEVLREAGPERSLLIESLQQKLVGEYPNRYVVLDVLAASYLEQGLLENALDMALQADAEQSSDGTVLLTLAEQIVGELEFRRREERHRYLELGVRALESLTKNHPKGSGAGRAKYMLSDMYVDLASTAVAAGGTTSREHYLEKAIAQLTNLTRFHPGSEYAELANLRKGDLLLLVMKDSEGALESYQSGAVNSRRYGDLFAARIGAVYLGLDRTSDAKKYLDRLLASGVQELSRTGLYYTGLMLTFSGEYQSARDTLTHLAEFDTGSPYTNDAIETAWIIEEGLQGTPMLLDSYMAALKAGLIGDTTTVIQKLRVVSRASMDEPLRSRALFKLALTYQMRDDLGTAMRMYKQFLSEHPGSSLRPDAQRGIARIYEYGYGNFDVALKEYEAVLIHYPDYTFLDEVREDIKRLRFIVKGEEIE